MSPNGGWTVGEQASPVGRRPAGPGRRRRLLVVAAVALAVLVAAVFGVVTALGQEPTVTATQFDSLLPSGTRVGGVAIGEGDLTGRGGGDYLGEMGFMGTCLADLVSVAGADAEGLSTGGGSMGVDPATGLVAGNSLHVWADRFATPDAAKARYQKLQRSREQSGCFTGSEQQQVMEGRLLDGRTRSPRWEVYGDGKRGSYLLAQRGNVVFVALAVSVQNKEDAHNLASELTARVDLLGDE
ncbi:hypothetical protein [Microlunatus flavus]|uniref:hypothetical protein n=1 Tax=Microlunatus flavus TaxID=1036181 RepID=UPI000B870A0B|nr:hypothetical protein [Microlunatus flavus]